MRSHVRCLLAPPRSACSERWQGIGTDPGGGPGAHRVHKTPKLVPHGVRSRRRRTVSRRRRTDRWRIWRGVGCSPTTTLSNRWCLRAGVEQVPVSVAMTTGIATSGYVAGRMVSTDRLSAGLAAADPDAASTRDTGPRTDVDDLGGGTPSRLPMGEQAGGLVGAGRTASHRASRKIPPAESDA